jgi:hypothetical protein
VHGWHRALRVTNVREQPAHPLEPEAHPELLALKQKLFDCVRVGHRRLQRRELGFEARELFALCVNHGGRGLGNELLIAELAIDAGDLSAEFIGSRSFLGFDLGWIECVAREHLD